MTGKVKYLPWITRDLVRAKPESIFVFGDNAQRYGLGGQAKEMRGEPNAVGVATLYAPGEFYDDNPDILRIVSRDLFIVARWIQAGKTVYLPRDGLGTGLARLAEYRPDISNLITAFFKACPGEPCTWEYI